MNQSQPERKIFRLTVGTGDAGAAAEFLAHRTRLSRSLLKRLMNSGAVWLKRKDHRKLVRLRRATMTIHTGDYLEVCYEAKILSEKPQTDYYCFGETDHYGVWYKPPGMLTQGSKFGDHCSLLRQVERERGKAFLVHRLDKEAQGLLIVAYTSEAAAQFGRMLQQRELAKIYRVRAYGKILQQEGVIGFPLDGKEAETRFTVLAADVDYSDLRVQIVTGRMHQIRRHLKMIGHPVVGDRRYGGPSAADAKMILVCCELKFADPFSTKNQAFTLEQSVVDRLFQGKAPE